MSARPTLVIFTETYPFDAGAEEMFLVPELMALAHQFSQIIVVPETMKGEQLVPPKFVEVETSFARSRVPLGDLQKVRYALGAIVARSILKEVFSGWPSTRLAHAWKKAMRRYVNSQYARDWVRAFAKRRKLDPYCTVYYTYWLNAITEGLVLAANSSSAERMTIVSRAHGSDLYEDISIFHSLPGRRATLSGLSALFLVSEYGRSYVSERYPGETRYLLSRLGVPDPRGITRASEDGVFRVVSCSFTKAVKRIDLLFDGLVVLAERYPNQLLEWTHIGAGELWGQLVARVRVGSPRNLSCRLVGHFHNGQVIAEYLTNPFDVFVNVSSSEGIPVSIMEAQSCGIPVIATDVGGNPEIVSTATGALLPSNPSASCVASTIASIMESERSRKELKIASRDNWRTNYDASLNYSRFAKTLRDMIPVSATATSLSR